MSKSKKFILRAIPVLLLVVVLVASPVLGFSNFNPENVNDNIEDKSQTATTSDTLNNSITGLWGTITLILQIAAVAAVVFAGVRYMFASASDKANIKQQMLILAIGAILVFGASTVVQLIVKATNDIAGGAQ